MFSRVFALPRLVFLEQMRCSATTVRRLDHARGSTMADRRMTMPRRHLVSCASAGRQR